MILKYTLMTLEYLSNCWDSHIAKLDRILDKLEENNFIINPRKCEWAVKETDWLGYWLTPEGIKTWSKKVDAILRMKAPSNATELRTFLGMITYYKSGDLISWLLLQLYQAYLKKAKIERTNELDLAFKRVKAVIVQFVLMNFPNHNKDFDIYTDSSDYQLGACIMQDGRPVAYYSKKTNWCTKNKTTQPRKKNC